MRGCGLQDSAVQSSNRPPAALKVEGVDGPLQRTSAPALTPLEVVVSVRDVQLSVLDGLLVAGDDAQVDAGCMQRVGDYVRDDQSTRPSSAHRRQTV